MEHVDQEDRAQAVVRDDRHQVIDRGDQRPRSHGRVHLDLVEKHRDQRSGRAGDEHGQHQ